MINSTPLIHEFDRDTMALFERELKIVREADLHELLCMADDAERAYVLGEPEHDRWYMVRCIAACALLRRKRVAHVYDPNRTSDYDLRRPGDLRLLTSGFEALEVVSEPRPRGLRS